MKGNGNNFVSTICSPDKRVQLALWWKIMTEKRYQLKDKNHESKH